MLPKFKIFSEIRTLFEEDFSSELICYPNEMSNPEIESVLEFEIAVKIEVSGMNLKTHLPFGKSNLTKHIWAKCIK